MDPPPNSWNRRPVQETGNGRPGTPSDRSRSGGPLASQGPRQMEDQPPRWSSYGRSGISPSRSGAPYAGFSFGGFPRQEARAYESPGYGEQRQRRGSPPLTRPQPRWTEASTSRIGAPNAGFNFGGFASQESRPYENSVQGELRQLRASLPPTRSQLRWTGASNPRTGVLDDRIRGTPEPPKGLPRALNPFKAVTQNATRPGTPQRAAQLPHEGLRSGNNTSQPARSSPSSSIGWPDHQPDWSRQSGSQSMAKVSVLVTPRSQVSRPLSSLPGIPIVTSVVGVSAATTSSTHSEPASRPGESPVTAGKRSASPSTSSVSKRQCGSSEVPQNDQQLAVAHDQSPPQWVQDDFSPLFVNNDSDGQEDHGGPQYDEGGGSGEEEDAYGDADSANDSDSSDDSSVTGSDDSDDHSDDAEPAHQLAKVDEDVQMPACPDGASSEQPPNPPLALNEDDVLIKTDSNAAFASVDRSANAKKRRQRAMSCKFEFNNVRYSLEDLSSSNDRRQRYAKPLSRLASYFEHADSKDPDVLADPDMSNPLHYTISFGPKSGYLPLDFAAWHTLLPPSDDGSQNVLDAWFNDSLIMNMVQLDSDRNVAGGFLCDPSPESVWLHREMTIEQRLERMQSALNGLKADHDVPTVDGAKLHFPAKDMPIDATFLVMPYNTGGHWVALKIEPNLVTLHGTITYYDSYYRQSPQIVKVIPLFAELLASRPGLGWKQEHWAVVEGQSTRQRNAFDCGPIAADNLRHLLQGRSPQVVKSAANIAKYGDDLRFDTLTRLSSVLLGEDLSSTPTAAAEDSSETTLVTNHPEKPPPATGPARLAGRPGVAIPSIDSALHDGRDVDEADGEDLEQPDESWLYIHFGVDIGTPGEAAGTRELLCNILMDYESVDQDDLVSQISTLAPAADDVEHFRAVTAVLEETPSLFQWFWKNGLRHWRLRSGAGRSVDTATIKRLLADCAAIQAKIELPLRPQRPWRLALVVVRTSGKQLYGKMQDHLDRAESILRAYHDALDDGDLALPTRIDPSAADPIEMDPDTRYWMPCLLDGCSSTRDLYTLLIDRVGMAVAMLSEMNSAAEGSDRPGSVLVLGNSLDGLSTNVDGWQKLQDAVPNLEFQITLALPKATYAESWFPASTGSVPWASYQLGEIISTLGSAPPAISSTQEIYHRQHNERFLLFCQLIDAAKLDYSLEKTVGRHMAPLKASKLGFLLARKGFHRKHFDLGEDGEDRPSDECSEASLRDQSVDGIAMEEDGDKEGKAQGDKKGKGVKKKGERKGKGDEKDKWLKRDRWMFWNPPQPIKSSQPSTRAKAKQPKAKSSHPSRPSTRAKAKQPREESPQPSNQAKANQAKANHEKKSPSAQPRIRKPRGRYANLICSHCRKRRIKCQLVDDGSVIPSTDPQPTDKACDSARAAESQESPRKRARGSYAKLICFRCRERRIKCQLADDGSVIPSTDPQPVDKACVRCRQQGLECIVRKTTLGRPNLKKQRVIITPASSGPSLELEVPSRSPSPDQESLVFLTLDENQSSGRARSASVKELPTGVHMYGAVNRTLDLTSSFLGRDKRFASAIEALKHKQPKPVQEILSEEVTALLDEHLIWHRLYMPWLPGLLVLRKEICETTTVTGHSHSQSAVALLALLALIALDVRSDRLDPYRGLRTELHCIVYHLGQKLLFTLPRNEYAVVVLELIHNHKPLALLGSHQAAAHTLSGNLFGTLIHAMHQRLGMNTAARRLRARLQTDSASEPSQIEALVFQVLRWCAVTMWRISLDLEELETTRSEAYEPELELREAFDVVGRAIDRFSLDRCFFLFHVLRYHADDVIATREVTVDCNNIPKLSEHVAAHVELRMQRQKAFDDGLTRFFFSQNRTQEGLALSQLIRIEQGQGYSSVLGLALFYAIMAGSRAMQANGKDKEHPFAQLSQYYTERVAQEAKQDKRSPTWDFLDQYGDLHIEALERRLTDFINASTDVYLNGVPYIGPARHTSSNILLACKEILENNAVRIKLEGTLHERIDMQLILFGNAARHLEGMEADGGSADAVARGSVFTACAKLIRSLHRIMWQWKRSYALGTTKASGQQNTPRAAVPVYTSFDGSTENPFPIFNMGLDDFSSDGLFSNWDDWPQYMPNDMSSLFSYDLDAQGL